MTVENDPPHPIVERPWEYKIIGLNYQFPRDETPSFLDLTLCKGSIVRRLRFLHPRELTIERGFPIHTGGLLISDGSARQWEGVGVRVHDFELTHGAVEFWAAEVSELDDADADA